MPYSLSLRSLLLPALAALLLTATGCEQVVDLDLGTAASQLVIQSSIADDGKPAVANLSRSVNFDQTNVFQPVAGATLVLSDDAGQSETLRETSPGQYAGRTVLGVAGRTYTLRVETADGSFVATSRLPAAVPLLALRTEEPPFKDKDKPNVRQAVAEYQDPAGEGNYYRFRQWRNGRPNNSILVQSDKFNDDQLVKYTLRNRTEDPDDLNELVVGDSVTVELQTIDNGAYEYFRTLALIANGAGASSAAPTNPLSNFSGGVLGYFSAYAQQRRTVLVR